MAGIEHLESYIVRWVQVDEGNTISWSIQPHKKSINFGIVKHPGTGANPILLSTDNDIGSPHTHGTSEGKSGRLHKRDTTAQELLSGKGFISIAWIGKCEADKVSMGTHDIPTGQSGMYGLVFDNTFSKQTSKTATFVILTYPTGAPPQSANHLPNLQQPNARGSQTSLGKHAQPAEGIASPSSDSLHSHTAAARPASASGRSEGGSSNHHVGTLSKRRRKKGQGYARRFFSLDYSTCTLSYYYNRNSSALRGAIPLSLAAIAADERRREISIDSGAEVWHLRAPNSKEFQDWARALEKASRIARGMETQLRPSPSTKSRPNADSPQLHKPSRLISHQEDTEWQQVEALVSRVVGTRDALRRLTKEVAAQASVPAHVQAQAHAPMTSPSANSLLSPGHPSAGTEDKDGYFPAPTEKRSFWRRKSTAAPPTSSTQKLVASALAVPSPDGVVPSVPANGARVSSHARKPSRSQAQLEVSLQDHCQSLLTDLDSVVSEFTSLINTSKRRRLQSPLSPVGASRKSIETTASSLDEFFDAEEADSAVVKVDGSDDGDETHSDEVGSIHDNSSVSSVDDDEDVIPGDSGHLFPAKPKNLAPLPVNMTVQRRTTIPPATVAPPSLIAFARKNVGKDFSTIAMPVSANEPLSLLQKVAEQLEYATLLDQAVRQKGPTERLLYVTAFAVSHFSGNRARERAARKPFTPLLGETFELVRTEQEVPGGFRLLVEKVQHRPLRLAMQADSANWSFSQSPAPGQKFWGKSAEVTTEGRVRIALRLPDGEDELYSWNIATMFLRNVVMGEKYMEPVGSMHVFNDSTGHKATVEFKSKGMFGGRVEEVHATTFGPDGSNTGSGLTGNWTSELRTVGPGKAASYDIWNAGDLVDNAAQTYGLTVFAASLNEITEVEKGKLPPSDCRFRPDQRLAEAGNFDEADDVKVKLEEAQRARRRVVEDSGEPYKPRWFVKAEDTPEGEEVWKIKGGKDGYWEERARGTWAGVEKLFDV
ncbi:unnamed protein product [Clonostachys rosea]|uniref:PH domain-containing protein n=1 Tax=Bionectria ochroleuca TaxID=29856 RepID=A0ABY6UBU4_BIOOC|nr:unnamed protein product [Clonostachys rosea]